jgi:DNA-directed RNA polymerase subunit N (RpoN/RPB10)
MLIPIVCFSCGHVLADKYLCFLKERDILVNKKFKNKKVTIDEISISENEIDKKHFDDNISKEVLDKLNIDRICFRRHFLSTVDLIEHI